VLVVVSDTHGTDRHRLRGRTLEAVREADLVAHAGDFLAEPVLDAFEDVATELVAVYGNNDDAAIRDRLPADRVFEYAGVRIALTHGHGPRRDPTARSLFGRERNAALVVSGHSHRPGFDASGPVALLDPGSHAEPRAYRPAHAELAPAEGGRGLDGRICTPDGETLTTVSVSAGVEGD
jgi:putative phosphoesterase